MKKFSVVIVLALTAGGQATKEDVGHCLALAFQGHREAAQDCLIARGVIVLPGTPVPQK